VEFTDNQKYTSRHTWISMNRFCCPEKTGEFHIDYSDSGPIVLAVCGFGLRDEADSKAILDFERALMAYQVNVIDAVEYSSHIPPCFKCGRIKECRIGGAYHMWGEKAHTMELTQDRFRRWEDNPETNARINEAAKKLKIEKTPVVMRCDSCSNTFEVNVKDNKDIECPDCGSAKCSLISGRDYYKKEVISFTGDASNCNSRTSG
jgi:hypothetical protein